jgi:hypothetical protein
MTKFLAGASAVIALALASAAYADGGPVTATLEQPGGHAKLIAAHAVFRCDGATCVASVAPDETGTLEGCKSLAKQVGRVSSYAQFKPFDEKQLAACNAVAAAPKAPTATASR